MTTQFNWLLYMEVAEYLVRQRGESYYRSAISRAYYGAFCYARDTLARVQSRTSSRRGDAHEQVINALKSDPRPEVADLGESLHRLHTERNRADYRTRVQFVVSRARGALSAARKICDGITTSFP